jgi:hypothetical protein
LRLRNVRRPIDVLLLIVAVLSFVVPVVGMPFWALANARVTRRRGEDAIRFYAKDQPVAEGAVGVTLFPELIRRVRRWMVAGVLLVGFLLAALALLVPLGRLCHRLPPAGRGLAEFGLLFPSARSSVRSALFPVTLVPRLVAGATRILGPIEQCPWTEGDGRSRALTPKTTDRALACSWHSFRVWCSRCLPSTAR